MKKTKKSKPKEKKNWIKQSLIWATDMFGFLAIFYLMLNGYFWLVLIGLLAYSIYVIYRRWDQMTLMFAMIDTLVLKYKMARKWKEHVKRENERRT